MSTIAGFFSMDPDAVRAAMALLASAGSSGVVTNRHTLRPTRDGLVTVAGGILDDAIFGTTDAEHRERFGHVEVSRLLHPIVLELVRAPLSESELRSVALGELAIRDGVAVRPEMNPREGDLVGPAGVTAYLRAKVPDSRALEFCELARVPVLPRAVRPFVRDLDPRMSDPWVGPLNERFVALVDRADRHARLRAMKIPEVITGHEQCEVQRELFRLFDTLMPLSLTPALTNAPATLSAEDAIGIAWAGESLVVQQHDHVSVVGIDGELRMRFAPAPCQLRGVVGEGLVVFEQAFMAAFTYRPRQVDISVLDLQTGAYLVLPPRELPREFVSEGGHGDLFLLPVSPGTEGAPWSPFRYGSHHERFLAYSNDLRFAWGGEPGVGSAIVELGSAIPHALPLEPTGYVDPVQPSVAAIGFTKTGWRLLWPNGVLADLRGTAPIALPFVLRAASFSPDAETLAVIVDEEILILAASDGSVRRRMPLPR